MGAGRCGELWGDVGRCLELSEEGPKKGCKGGMREEGRGGEKEMMMEGWRVEAGSRLCGKGRGGGRAQRRRTGTRSPGPAG